MAFKLSDATDPSRQRWTSLNSNLQITQFTGIGVDPTNPSVVYGGSQDNGVEKYSGQPGWQRLTDPLVGGDGGLTRVDPSNHDRIYSTYVNVSLSVSNDDGSTFKDVSGHITFHNDPMGNPIVNFYAPYVLSSAGALYYGTDILNYSTNQGTSWSAIGTPNVAGFNPQAGALDARDAINAIAVSVDSKDVYVSVHGHIFVAQSPEKGGAWTQTPDLPNGGATALNSLAVDPTNGATAYAVVSAFTGGSANHVFKLTNLGTDLTDISGNLPDYPVDSIAVSADGATIYVGTDVGVYSSSDGGAHWAPLGAGLPHVQVVDLALVPGQHLLAAATHGRGVWVINGTTGLAPTITSTNTTTFTVGTMGSFPVTTTGIGQPALGTSGTLPAGFKLNDKGDGTATLSGTPGAGQGGTYTFTITAHNGTAPAVQQTFLLKVTEAPTITSMASGTFTVGTMGSFTVRTGNHFPAAVTLSETGTLPRGVAFRDNGDGTATLTGTPTDGGTFSLTFTAKNGVAPDGTQTFTLTVRPPALALVPTDLPAAQQGTHYQQTLAAAGGTSPYVYTVSAGVLPSGLSLDQATGILSGTPTQSGTFQFTIAATDASGGTGPYTQTHDFTLTIAAEVAQNGTLVLKVPQRLHVHGTTVAFKGHGISFSDTDAHALAQVKVTTSAGRFHLKAAGVKIKGNNSRVLTLSGHVAAVNRALNSLALLLGKPHGKAKVTISATAGHQHRQATIAID
jgi:hypothetical protein